MNAITKDQWAKIGEELQSYFVSVEFKYQDTVITVHRERSGESRTVLSVYFDGKICLGWGFESLDSYNPITKLFWCEKKQRYYSPKRVAEIEKAFGKRAAKKYYPKLHESKSYRTPCFSSSTSLIRQFKKVDGLSWISETIKDTADAN
ncbi:hypothetical protein Bresa_00614|uniref:Uncharacterized protein n=1 Tax=Brenneria salicis ATCC 15712 = DSM 30166 TaxID=714314 RepID=A0A366I7C0_9GAMM|nr:hypothetical protein [Brenneria salicis]NMN90538.1 hypothetical protein [Brenneria salicis ATCC 15712 = DSM 30166]RBP64868.1 hypothetical protein DES54_10693 [Brenneria salicis ATCC 15712 = DSM 30166]RLM31627.1 hypothetical protein BHG07_04835 [Brenneria salicis ATCC 15712 = DSM 30166]